ncbi:LINE-1 retrotransposable element ORF2 protein [Vitis vinifera]|uniref:LINE-1 retrotransposable element ORF2 protein n=1 Tax=Vitis vinifera TaxID=29760 RepID=A0A438IHV3_VITVI|nr:LINE-1 retrotransposable element ORF2 protein [Vitis vinifera]
MGELTRHLAEAHSGIAGGRREVEDRSTAGKVSLAGATDRLMEWREGQKAGNAPGRTRGTKWTEEGNSWPSTSFNSKFKSLEAGGVGPKQEGKVKAQSNLMDEIWASKHLSRAQYFSKPRLMSENDVGWKRGSPWERPDPADGQESGGKPTVMRGSKKLWNVLLPSSSESRQGDRSREKPVTAERSPTGSDSLSVEEVAEVGISFVSRGEGGNAHNAIGEDGEGVKGFVGYTHSGSSVADHPSYHENREKGLIFGEDCGLTKVGTFQVSAHLSPQPSLPLRYPFSDGGMNLMSESLIYDMTNSSSPHGVPILGAVSKGVSDFSQTSGFHIEGLSPSKMAKVCEVFETKRRVVKDFLRLQNPDVVMFQETKREVCDRRFVGSVWSVRNKEWAILPACGASGGILIIWDSKKMRVYGPNNPSIRKEFWVELSDLFGLTYPSWSHRLCKRLDRFLYSNEWELSFPQSLQEVLPRWTSDHWPIVLDTNPFKWGPTPFRFENMWLQHHNFKESFSSWWREFEGNGWEANIDAIEQEGALSSDLAAQRAIRKGMANGRRNKNFIKILENERGLVLDSSESITEEILLYFKKLYSCPTRESWRVEGIDWSPISEESASRLDSPFAEAEIFNAIFQLDRDKAPGPDGFTIAVFQDCWDVIKEDLVRVFAEFHNSGIINQNTNASFIVLLPKKRRLRGVLQETIHSTQGAFVQGRQILDAVLITNEIVDEKKRSGEEGVVFKIDFEKAYDHVKWDFLDHVLEKKGWVKAARGLRQGDPLSPFLFTIVADVLSRMLLKAEERNLLEGFRVGRNRCRVSHLQFADDTILFASPREEEVQTLKSLLLVFGQISGLKVNLDKSNLFGINLDQNHLSRLALLLDCKASDWPILYLGLPLGGNPTACGFWDPMIEESLGD